MSKPRAVTVRDLTLGVRVHVVNDDTPVQSVSIITGEVVALRRRPNGHVWVTLNPGDDRPERMVSLHPDDRLICPN